MHWISVRTCRDGGKCNGREGPIVGQMNALAVATPECFWFAMTSIAIDRPDGVDDISGRKLSRRGDHRLTRRKAADLSPDLAALSKNRWSTTSMNGSINPAPAEQGRVGGVHDCIRSFTG